MDLPRRVFRTRETWSAKAQVLGQHSQVDVPGCVELFLLPCWSFKRFPSWDPPVFCKEQHFFQQSSNDMASILGVCADSHLVTSYHIPPGSLTVNANVPEIRISQLRFSHEQEPPQGSVRWRIRQFALSARARQTRRLRPRFSWLMLLCALSIFASWF